MERSKNLVFDCREVNCRAPNRLQDLRRREKNNIEEDMNQRSGQEAPKVTIYRPCRGILSSPEAVSDFGPASIWRRRGVDESNICLRRRLLKLLSKLKS